MGGGPDPDHPMVPLDEEVLKHRRYLRYVMYGTIYVIFAYLAIGSIINAILGLLSTYIAYVSWATLSQCQLLIQMIFLTISCLTTLPYLLSVIGPSNLFY